MSASAPSGHGWGPSAETGMKAVGDLGEVKRAPSLGGARLVLYPSRQAFP